MGYRDCGIQLKSWAVFDVSVLFAAVLLLTRFGRAVKFSCSLAMALCLAFCVSNIAYSRIFNIYLPCDIIGEAGNLPLSEVWNYFVGALRLSDLLLLFIAISYGIAVKAKGLVKAPVPYCFTAVPFVLGTVLYGGFVLGKAIKDSVSIGTSIKGNAFIPHPYDEERFNPRGFVAKLGWVRAELLFKIKNMPGKASLDEVDRLQIAEYLASRHFERQDVIVFPQGKPNIVLLLCESYLSVSSGLVVDGREVTPNMNELRHDVATFYNGNVVPGVGAGESSDGQFIYMTGLAPLKNGIAADYVLKSDIPCLGKYLRERGYETFMTVPTPKNIWSQDCLCPKYHIDHLYGAEDYGESAHWLGDDRLVDFAISNEKRMRPPFFHIILTSSTHSPYDGVNSSMEQCACAPRNFPDKFTKEYCNYLGKVHFMDHQIGRYVDYLKQSGKWDNTVLVILSDHGLKTAFTKMSSHDMGNNHMPLYICNIRKSQDTRSLEQRMIRQVDVFPTLLDVLNIKADYRGVGNSLFCNRKDDGMGEAISEKILYGGYFNK